MTSLGIIPCSKEKIWDEGQVVGPVLARRAYTSPLHLAARDYAERHVDEWVILSALHGLLRPDDLVPKTYDVTFDRRSDPVIGEAELRAQVHDKSLDAFEVVVVLCGPRYTERARAAFAGLDVALVTPLEGIDGLDAMTRWLRVYLDG